MKRLNRSRKYTVRRMVVAIALVIASTTCIKVAARNNTTTPTQVRYVPSGTAGMAIQVSLTNSYPLEVVHTVDTTTSTVHSRGGQVNDDVLLLAKLIESEAAGESYSGKLAVGTVIMNRTVHPNKRLYGGPTIKGVIYKRGQFDGVNTDLFKKYPSKDSLKAAHEVAVEGYRTYGKDVVFYFNPKTSTDQEFISSVKVVGKIGRHNFAINK